MTPLSRRDFVIGGAAALGGLVIGGAAATVANRGSALPQPSPSTAGLTFDQWLQTRQAPYFIGHRGAGGVAPEHTLPSYQMALAWGAQCVEISVVMSSDHVLFCLHDLTLDRTTTMKGPASSKTAAELDTAKVSIPRLGPRWTGVNMPPMPRLSDVLTELGGKAVLCIEPKDDSAYPVLIDMIKEHKLEKSVMIKLDASSPRIATAKSAGFPVFAYLGNAQVATEQAVVALAKRLDPQRDALVLPARDDHDLMPRQAVPDRGGHRGAGLGVPGTSAT